MSVVKTGGDKVERGGFVNLDKTNVTELIYHPPLRQVERGDFVTLKSLVDAQSTHTVAL